MKKSAKSKFKAIRKAVSMDKGINKADVEEEPHQQVDKEKKGRSGLKMPKIKNPPILKGLFGKKKKKQKDTTEKTETSRY